MAKQLQLRRGTTIENDTFVGAIGELAYDTEKKQLRMHDGETLGGFTIDPLVAFQVPTADNNYTWYRKYASGWVEQGGVLTNVYSGWQANTSFELPIEMENTFYYIGYINAWTDKSGEAPVVQAKSTTSFTIAKPLVNNANNPATWEVKGMAKIGE